MIMVNVNKKKLNIILIQIRGIYNIIYIIDKMEEWFKLGFIKTILVLIIILIKKYENKKINYALPVAVSILSSIILIIYSIKYLNLKDFKDLNPYFVIIIAICIAISSFISYKIIKITPNPAYIRIFSAIDMIIILLISYLFFKEKITCMMLIGFVLISLGVIILTYY
tara:strand:+ start:1403 stop:1906 length:504 start_codon:yes stop_codon:yes gene_type:complete